MRLTMQVYEAFVNSSVSATQQWSMYAEMYTVKILTTLEEINFRIIISRPDIIIAVIATHHVQIINR